MPKPKEGQDKKEYISYCISYIKKNEPSESGKSDGYLYHKCEALWNKYKASDELAETLMNDGYVPVNFSYSKLKFTKLDNGKISMSDMKETSKNGRKYTTVDAVVAVADRFYGKVFVGNEVLRRTAKYWENTYNDLSHLATAFPAGLSSIENLEYITGYNSEAKFDETLNAVRLKMHINHDSPKYKAWKNFVDVSIDAGKVPNVSIFGFAKYKAVKPEKLPKDVKMSEDKLINGYVVVMEDLIPFAVTTCIKGKCDDAAGCGICEATADMNKKDWDRIESSCNDGTCVTNENEEENDKTEVEECEADKRLREYYMKRLKDINGER